MRRPAVPTTAGLTVAATTAAGAGLCLAITWFAAMQRQQELHRLAPLLTASEQEVVDAAGRLNPYLIVGDATPWADLVPSPAASLPAIAGVVAAATAVIALALTVAVALLHRGRRSVAALVVGALGASVLTGCGPLGFLAAPLIIGTRREESLGELWPHVTQPLGWRAAVAMAVVVLLGGPLAWLARRLARREAPTAAADRSGGLIWAILGAGICAVALAVGSPEALIAGNDAFDSGSAATTALVLLVLAGCAALTGADRPGRAGVGWALGLVVAGGLGAIPLASLGQSGGGWSGFGWELTTDTPWLGTGHYAVLIALAPFAGWLAGTIARHLASGGDERTVSRWTKVRSSPLDTRGVR